MKALEAYIAAGLLLVGITVCGGPADITGSWRADDRTGMKVIRSDG